MSERSPLTGGAPLEKVPLQEGCRWWTASECVSRTSTNLKD